ncbi:hypothetical protein CSUB01_03541 [Colletotrichum sublineola]|uniref:Uncharacterized protein n=1 Tax=Colletotrichum sublineola TaxID=1173701 RepID=A0A066X7V4_COLSU|nr:hypothetical protein CSUB01_03541 [Colletotrichum sublineola]
MGPGPKQQGSVVVSLVALRWLPGCQAVVKTTCQGWEALAICEILASLPELFGLAGQGHLRQTHPPASLPPPVTVPLNPFGPVTAGDDRPCANLFPKWPSLRGSTDRYELLLLPALSCYVCVGLIFHNIALLRKEVPDLLIARHRVRHTRRPGQRQGDPTLASLHVWMDG